MNLYQIFQQCAELGIKLQEQNESIKINAPKGAMTKPLLEAIKANKDAIIAHILQSKTQQQDSTITAIYPQQREAALSSGQNQMWLINSANSQSDAYHFYRVLHISGAIDADRLEQSIFALVERYTVLRTVYVERDEQIVQQVLNQHQFSLNRIDATEDGQKAEQAIADFKALNFDLSVDLMLKAMLIKQGEDSYQLHVKCHHIATDGWSIGLIVQQLTEAYNEGLLSNDETPLQYIDFAHWQSNQDEQSRYGAAKRFFADYLKDVPPVHGLPVSRNNTNMRPLVSEQSIISLELTEKLRQLCQNHNVTLFSLLQFTFAIVVSRYSRSNDVLVGSPVANRPMQQLAEMVGYFVNTLPVRSQIDHDAIFADALQRFNGKLLEAMEMQNYPLQNIVQDLQVPRHTGVSPLVQLMLTLQNNDIGELKLGDAALAVETPDLKYIDLDLNVECSETQAGIEIRWMYGEGLFSKTTIAGMAKHFGRLLGNVVNNARTPIKQLAMLDDDEIAHLSEGLNQTHVSYPSEQTIHGLFEQVAASHADDVALSFGDASLSYGELNRKANLVAQNLQQQYGIGKDDLVGICTPRSIEMVIAVMAILKAGGAYFPVDLEHGKDIVINRLTGQQVKATLVTTDTFQALTDSVLTDTGLNLLDVQDFLSGNDAAGDNPQSNADCESLAYVLSSSGTTGKPKMIGLPHKALHNLLVGICADNNKIKQQHRVLQFASIGFDMSFTDMAMSLLQGGSLVLLEESQRYDIHHLVKVLKTERISLVNLPYSMVKLLSEYCVAENIELPDLQVILSTAEKLEITDDIRRFFDNQSHIALINHFGPTETHVCTTYNLTGAPADWPNEPSIGKPISNSQCLVVGQDNNLVPYGCVGQLMVSGDCLARGYINNAELTAEKFHTINIPGVGEKRVYNTGDLVSWDGDNLVYQGRGDDQIKLNGFRVELPAIEEELSRFEALDKVVVLFDAVKASLAAYYTVKEDVTAEQVRAFAVARMPSYMVPKYFIKMDGFELNINGKINKKVLPKPQQSEVEYEAPQSQTEQALADIWSELLNLKAVKPGRQDNFFMLGGHSLLVMRLVAKVRKALSVEMPLQIAFDSQTLLDMAFAIDQLPKLGQDNAIVPVEKGLSQYQTSFAQQRLWLIDSIQGGSAEYNMPIAFDVQGELDLKLLTEVFTTIIERHQVLRTTFSTQGVDTYQIIRPMSEVDFSIGFEDLSCLTRETAQNRYKMYIDADVLKAFDLSSDVLLRASFYKIDDASGVLTFNMHHIASDGWSLEVLTQEVFTLYNALKSGQGNPLPPLAIQYVDYAHWQRENLSAERLSEQLDYWKGQLADVPPVHSLPLCKGRPEDQQHIGAVIESRLPKAVSEKLDALAKAFDLTPFMLYHGAFALLLSRHSYSTDIVIGTPVANRRQAELESLIGFFVNTLVLRTDTNHANLADYFSHLRNVHIEAQSNQDVPFEQILDHLKINRSSAHTPLFQIMLTTNTAYGITDDDVKREFYLQDTKVSPLASDAVTTKFDLNVDMSADSQGLALRWEYDISLFEDKYIEQLNGHMTTLLQALADIDLQKEVALRDIDMLSTEQTEHLLFGLNNTQLDYDKDAAIHTLFERQAAQTPDATAIVFNDESLTYGQLNAKANQVAHHLHSQFDIKQDMPVGLCIERSFDMVIAVLAIMKAGGAYFPLDLEHGDDIMRNRAQENQLVVTLVSDATESRLNLTELPTLNLNRLLAQKGQNEQIDNLELAVAHTSLAYVLSSSGTTGKPKLIGLPHMALNNLIVAMKHDAPVLAKKHKVLQFASIGFDMSYTDMFLAFLAGGQLHLINEEQRYDVEYLVEKIKQEGITLTNLPYSMLKAIADMNVNQPLELFELQAIISTAEKLELTNAVKTLFDNHSNLTLINHFGPTETHVCTTFNLEGNAKDWPYEPAIGKPVANAQCLVLNSDLSLTPFGGVGELFVGGDCLAVGYLGQAKMTAEKFMENPYYQEGQANSSKLIYRTRDLVKYLPDGNIAYMGRADDQVKIRGYRVELKDVEAQLCDLPQVDSALVLARDFAGSKHLLAYVKPQQWLDQDKAREQLISDIKQQLTGRMPDYMKPSAILLQERWPLTPNGKVDKSALAQPDIMALQGRYVAPETEVEKQLVRIWSELLQIDEEKISTTANFFELGGQSLLAISMTREIESRFGIKMAIKDLFKHPVLSELSVIIADKQTLNDLQKAIQEQKFTGSGVL